MCEAEFPQLRPGLKMRAGGRPGESKTMIFATETLPRWQFLPRMRIVHQLREGNSNICFYGWGLHFSHLAGDISQALRPTPYRPVPTINKRVNGRSGLMIIADTPEIDNTRGFEQQRDAIYRGLKVTDGLRAWFVANKSTVQAWARVVKDIEETA
jgi:hypothetical protein